MAEEQPGDVAIRTPDQHLRVFVSSTLAECADERAAVASAISALRLTPVLPASRRGGCAQSAPGPRRTRAGTA